MVIQQLVDEVRTSSNFLPILFNCQYCPACEVFFDINLVFKYSMLAASVVVDDKKDGLCI